MRLLGYRPPAVASPFPTGLRGVPSDNVPRFVADTGSSSHELLLLFEVMAHLTGPTAPTVESPPLRFRPPRDITRATRSRAASHDSSDSLDLLRFVSPASHDEDSLQGLSPEVS